MPMEVPNWFVCVLGMGVTFVGLICLIFITRITGLVCRLFGGEEKKQEAAPAPAAPAAEAIPNRGALIAAVSAAVAEELGTDVSAIRILSFRRVN